MFGSQDNCRHYYEQATVSWPTFGLGGLYTTLGGFTRNGHPDVHGNGCKYRSQVYADHLTATGRFWHTDRGLRIGDSAARVLAVYPGAVPVAGGLALHQRSVPWDASTYVVDLTAVLRHGVVTAFVITPGAEGD